MSEELIAACARCGMVVIAEVVDDQIDPNTIVAPCGHVPPPDDRDASVTREGG